MKTRLAPWLVRLALLAAAGPAATGCAAAAQAHAESPAPPPPFKLTLAAARPYAGAAARLDVRHTVAGQAPLVELAFSATDAAGRSWLARVVAPPGFAPGQRLVVPVTDRPLTPGQASVQQLASPEAEPRFARSGSLRLTLKGGRLAGDAVGAGPWFPARFEGPVVVSCAVPATADAPARPAPLAADAPVALVVDETFETPLCRPYAAWAPAGR